MAGLPPSTRYAAYGDAALVSRSHARKVSIATVGWCAYTDIVGVGSWGTWPTYVVNLTSTMLQLMRTRDWLVD